MDPDLPATQCSVGGGRMDVDCAVPTSRRSRAERRGDRQGPCHRTRANCRCRGAVFLVPRLVEGGDQRPSDQGNGVLIMRHPTAPHIINVISLIGAGVVHAVRHRSPYWLNCASRFAH